VTAPRTEPFRVAVYFDRAADHETALEVLRSVRPDVTEFAGIVEGWATADTLDELLAKGLTVDVIDKAALGVAVDDAAAPAETRSFHKASDLVASKPPDDPLRRRLDEFHAEAAAPARQSVDRDVFRIRLRSRLSDADQQALERLGVQLIHHAPHRWYRATVPTAQVDAVRALPFVEALEGRKAGDTITADLLLGLDEADRSPAEAAEPETFDVTLHGPEDVEQVRRVIEASKDAEVVQAAGATIRFRAPIRTPLLATLAAMPHVAMVAPYRQAKLFCDRVRVLVGVDALGAPDPPWTGDGELVGILDSGVDATHPDLAHGLDSNGAPAGGDQDDDFGHGTHVSGIVAGTGAASGGKIRGTAPGSKLLAVKITDGEDLDLPADMAELLRLATDKGAKIVNLSFGVPAPITGAVYDRYAHSTDQFVVDHPDVLVVVAAGNDGTAPDGDYGFGTLASPATAKNVLTVGASSTDRTDVNGTWGQRSPAVFTKPPARDEPVAGNPDLPAADSGRGPGSYGLVKPDVVAPGTYILAPRAAHISPQLPWRDAPEHDNRYVYIGGSSMAAPVAAGAAAVVRQYLRTERKVASPSAALLKAILVASATRLPSLRTAGSPTDFGFPDFDQGFGRIDLASVLPNPKSSEKHRLEFADVANDSADALESRAAVGSARKPLRTYTATVAEGAKEPLRIVLTWTDLAGSGVQNDLGLEIVQPGGKRISGNAEHQWGRDALTDHPDLFGILWDDRNTVEQIEIGEPAKGEYQVRVVARNTLAPQGYALVVSGDLDAELTVTA
jgi:subtilisin family serine protease